MKIRRSVSWKTGVETPCHGDTIVAFGVIVATVVVAIAAILIVVVVVE